MDLKLNIYDKKEITKTYTAETYDLMFGTVEDLLDVIDIDNIQASNKAELLKAIAKVLASSMNIVKPLLKEVFDGLTDEELRHTKLKEIMNVIAEIIAYSINQITKGNDGKKLEEGNTAIPLYQIFFELEMEICNRFPTVDPFSIRKEKMREIFLLVRRLRIYDEANNQNNKNKRKKQIRRPASDSWF